MDRIILSLDPGKSNFAFSVINEKYEILDIGFINNTVTDFTTVVKQAQSFKSEIKALVKKHKVTDITAERFMARNAVQGATGEFVSLMLGILLGFKANKKYITAAQWKNAFNRIEPLKDFYLKHNHLTNHEIDAVLIGVYYFHYFDLSKPYGSNLIKLSKELKKWK